MPEVKTERLNKATARLKWAPQERHQCLWSTNMAAACAACCRLFAHAGQGFGCCVTWLGSFWNGAIPDLVSELGSVVVHVNHIDHNVDGVFHLVAVQVHRMGSQLVGGWENTNMCDWKAHRDEMRTRMEALLEQQAPLKTKHFDQ